MANSQTLPRGLRNNNPLNIKKSPDKFRGELTISSDDTFKQFATLRDGVRAALRILKTYILHKAINTIHDIVARWCGEPGTIQDAYIRTVCDRTKLGEFTKIRWIDKVAICAIVAAMAFVECGRMLSDDLISDCYELA